MATGCLSNARTPDFKGLDRFNGRSYHTGQWPHAAPGLKYKAALSVAYGAGQLLTYGNREVGKLAKAVGGSGDDLRVANFHR